MRSVHHSVTGGERFCILSSSDSQIWVIKSLTSGCVCVCEWCHGPLLKPFLLDRAEPTVCSYCIVFFFCSFHTAHISVLYPYSHARWFLSVPSSFLLKIREIVCFVQSGPALMLEVGWHLLDNFRIWNNTWINNKQCKYEACITFYISINELKTADVIQTESERVKPASVEC